jgi:uncharacterized protein YjiS (DUF1127 family)
MFTSSDFAPAASFGRIARSWPVATPGIVAAAAQPSTAGSTVTLPVGVRRFAGSLRRHGGLATAAHVGAALLAGAAASARQYAKQWSQRHQRRLTERELRGLDASTLRDLGVHQSEITSLACEVAAEVQATRALASQRIAHRVV